MQLFSVTERRGEGKNYPEQMRFLYEFEDGLTVGAEAAWFNAPIPFTARWRVAFENGVLVNDGTALTAYRFGMEPKVYDTRDEVMISTGINVPPCGWYYNELKHFVECIREGKSLCHRKNPAFRNGASGGDESMNREKVSAYFHRIGLPLPEVIVPDGELLRKLQFAFCTAVPYENLDILRGIPLSLQEDDLFEKIVTRNRGGFCFELNGSFGWLLRELGYEVTDYFARYLRGESSIPMRRHRVLKVVAADGVYLADVGIGEICPREPLKLEEGTVQEQLGESYRLEKEDFLGWVLWDLHKGQWRKFYSFTEEPQLNVDFQAACFWCEKHPSSPFTTQEMFSLKTKEGRITLDGNVYKEFTARGVTVTECTPEEMPAVYARFGLSPQA